MKRQDVYGLVALLLLACIPVSWAFAGWAAASGWGANAVVGLALGYPGICVVIAAMAGVEIGRSEERERGTGS